MLGWKRLLFTLATAVPLGLLLSLSSQSSTVVVVARSIIVGLVAMLAFGLTERWPARMPNWLARWVLQLIAVVVAVPLGALLAYWVTLGGSPQFGQNQARVSRLHQPDCSRDHGRSMDRVGRDGATAR